MASDSPLPSWHATTILSIRKGGDVVIAGDGQVSLGDTVIKANARKVRRLAGDNVIAGFAGATADAFTLFERLEGKLEQVSQPVNAGRRGTCERLADGSLPAPARSDDGGRRQRCFADSDRQRRCA